MNSTFRSASKREELSGSSVNICSPLRKGSADPGLFKILSPKGIWTPDTVWHLRVPQHSQTGITFSYQLYEDLIGLLQLTLDSHAMPAIEMPRRQVTVMTPMMRMSLVRSTMVAPFSWGIKIRYFFRRIRGEDCLRWGRLITFIVLLTRIRSTTVSAKPTVCMATATALAKAKMRPMGPPSSGPRLRLIRK